MKLPRRAGGRRAPQVPSRTIAMCPLTAARASLTTKSMLGMPISVVMMDTGTPSNSPAGNRQGRALASSTNMTAVQRLQCIS
jgi:hypothetical protein